MLSGDFVIKKGQGIWSDIIEFVEDSPWTHVYSVIDSKSYLDPVWPVMNRIYGPIPQDSANHYVTVDLTDDERNKIGKELIKYVGQEYSLTALLWCGLTIYFPWFKKFKDPMGVVGAVCSTALAHAYYNTGLYYKLRVGDTPPDDVTPSMLAEAWVSA